MRAAGDAALRAFAGVLRTCVRDADVPARVGGDEFAVLAPHASPDQAQDLGGRIIAALAATPIAQGDGARVGASIGYAVYPRDGAQPDALLAAADRALYEVKRSGRGRGRVAAASGA